MAWFKKKKKMQYLGVLKSEVDNLDFGKWIFAGNYRHHPGAGNINIRKYSNIFSVLSGFLEIISRQTFILGLFWCHPSSGNAIIKG